jgi:hypothetical protein
MKLLFLHLSPFSFYLFLLESEYSPKHSLAIACPPSALETILSNHTKNTLL